MAPMVAARGGGDERMNAPTPSGICRPMSAMTGAARGTQVAD
jgi:hypothetical protein